MSAIVKCIIITLLITVLAGVVIGIVVALTAGGQDREVKNSDLDELKPGWHIRDEKSQRTVNDGDKKMDISMSVLSIN